MMGLISLYIIGGFIIWFFVAKRVKEDIDNKALWWEGSKDDWAFIFLASIFIIVIWPILVLISMIKK